MEHISNNKKIDKLIKQLNNTLVICEHSKYCRNCTNKKDLHYIPHLKKSTCEPDMCVIGMKQSAECKPIKR